MRPEILLLFTIGLLGLLVFTPVYTESLGLIEIKEYKVINSPKVCGDKLCEEIEGDSKISPLSQYKQGISVEKITCKEGLKLVLKNSNNQPACVKESTANILVQRGWATIPDLKIEKIPSDIESAKISRELGAEGIVLASESFVMTEFNPTVTITHSEIMGQDAIIFEGAGFRGFHVIDIIISNEQGLEIALDTKTSQGGNLFMPWLIPESLKGGTYSIVFSDNVSSHEIIINTSNEIFEKTILKLFDFKAIMFDGKQPIVFSGNLATEDGQRIPNAEIFIKSDGPCPSDEIIAKGTTDKYGKFWIYTLPKIWDPSDNMIKIHAEFLGNNQFAPSNSQDEVIVVFSNAEEC